MINKKKLTPSRLRTPRQFLDFFRAIPKERWLIGRYRSVTDDDRRCALGHLGASETNHNTSAGERLHNMFKDFLRDGEVYPVAFVNDGTQRYHHFGASAKQRICNVLEAIIKRGGAQKGNDD